MELLLPNERIHCPKGHKIRRRTWAIGQTPMLAERCSHLEPPGNIECGELVYWILVPGGMRIVAQISSAEAHAMETTCIGIEDADRCLTQILTFLGLRWPRAEV